VTSAVAEQGPVRYRHNAVGFGPYKSAVGFDSQTPENWTDNV